ncbi:DUF1073 domain-containing protein [Pseudovibrio sp. POLY-S9]|uniref:phage portal protein n=1 Tax=Pseudovibrio sp. POLY-S9 TaxID=1576596 RepID=UPI00070AB2F3|nr:DUF1073 domain-containing protein [Pseudovibrio sp. POLY-S9]
MNFMDGLRNLFSGLGIPGRDKSAGAQFLHAPISEAEILALFDGDAIAKKIAVAPSEDMVAKWREWTDPKVEAEEKKHRLRAKIRDTLIMAKRDGGAALVFSIRGQSLDQPLQADGAREGALQWIHPFSRVEITPMDVRRDPNDEWFGEPEYFVINTTMQEVKIHPSRVISFFGDERLRGVTMDPDYWGVSIYDALREFIRRRETALGEGCSLLPEMKTDIVKIPGLSALLADKDKEAKLRERMLFMRENKSNHGIAVMQGGDEKSAEQWEQKTLTLSQVPEMMQEFIQHEAGAADIPLTRLYGTSPKGLGANGDGETRNYYDRLKAEQETRIEPALCEFDEVLQRSSGAKTGSTFKWVPLKELDEKERGELFSKQADGVSKLHETGLFPEEVLADSSVTMLENGGTLTGIAAAYKEHVGYEDPPDEDDEDVTDEVNQPNGAGGRRSDAQDK